MWVFFVLVIVVRLYVCVCERDWSASALLVGNAEGYCERHCMLCGGRCERAMMP